MAVPNSSFNKAVKRNYVCRSQVAGADLLITGSGGLVTGQGGIVVSLGGLK